jgi:hypothetical protein
VEAVGAGGVATDLGHLGDAAATDTELRASASMAPEATNEARTFQEAPAQLRDIATPGILSVVPRGRGLGRHQHLV